jgi:hypothetical protein
MKRKRHRSVPDFSRKQSAVPHGLTPKVKMAPPRPLRAAKPQATSAKSGQRGR